MAPQEGVREDEREDLSTDPRQFLLFPDTEMDTASADTNAIKDAAEAEMVITKTITVKSQPSRRDLDMSGLPVKEENIYPKESLREDGALNDDLYVEIGTEESKRMRRFRPASTCLRPSDTR